jgi:hypothetical protein
MLTLCMYKYVFIADDEKRLKKRVVSISKILSCSFL